MPVQDENGQLNALLGKGSEFEGKLSFEGRVRIDGVFSGEVFTEGILIVGETARITAEIEVGSLIVHGEVRGNVVARDSIELHASSKLLGNIRTPVLIIERGAVYEGSCKMVDGEV